MTSPATVTPPVIVIAPDSFKGSLSATDAARAMAEGVRQVVGASAQIVLCPMADGGEGTLDAILSVWGVAAEQQLATDALGRERLARFGLSADSNTGVIEAAEANGLPLVSDVPLQPLRADSVGVGLLARELLDRGVDEILLCIGGSASTDGGTGLLAALGARFLDADGRDVPPGGGGLSQIRSIDLAPLHPRAKTVRWRVAVDVSNPLTGSRGAAAVFGPQKGATPADVLALDAGLATLAGVIDEATGIDMTDVPGAGAAGGMPATLVPLLGAELVPGSLLVADALGLPDLIDNASLVITGEGAFDAQSLDGKVVHAVTTLAARATAAAGTTGVQGAQGCPVVVIAGRVGLSADETRAAGVAAAFSIAGGPASLEQLTSTAAERVRQTAAQVAALFFAGNAT